MARSTNSTRNTRSNGASAPLKAKSPQQKNASRQAKQAGNQAAAQAYEQPSLFDDGTRNEIAGIACFIVGVILFIAAVLPTSAVVTTFVSQFLHLSFGLGAYILPFLFIAIGVCLVYRFERERLSMRVAIGLTVIFVALLAFFALFTPESSADATDNLFIEQQLTSHGGYVGAGIAWLGITLLGQVITGIVLGGCILIGVVIIGFSISSFIEKVREKQSQMHSSEPEQAPSQPVRPPASARIKRAASPQFTELPEANLDSLPTQVLGNIGSTEAPSALTRKLGRKKNDAEQSVEAAPKKKSKAPTPVASPSPAEGFELPSMSLLATSRNKAKDKAGAEELRETGERLQETLEDFNIMAQVVGWVAGPTVTLFKVDLPAGVRVSRVTALEDDIALALAAPGVRIFAPIPGTNYVGIEVPNRTRQTVLLGDVIKDAPAGPLQIAIGEDVEGNKIVSDLAKMPHLLIGGTTGSGKSVSINAMIMSILMRATPSEVRFIMIDPKRVEFTPYNGIPHLYVPVVTEPKEAASALSWGVAEMERRLKVFSKVGARNIQQYNAKVQQEKAKQELLQNASAEGDDTANDATQSPTAAKNDNALGDELPYIVIIIDELADLMMNVGKEVEFSISRIAQLARAAGIHLIVATQRPSTNVVTGLIKANITNRIAFNVASGIDSRVILDTPGAENLIGLGDLLLSKPEYAKPQRIQGCYVSEDEINSVVDMLKEQAEPEYHSEILQTNLITLGASQPDGSGGSVADSDPYLWDAAELVVSSGFGSTSNIQRRFKVGYSRAGRIMDELEEKGIVGPANGSKPREVLVDAMELETLKAFEANDASNTEA